MLSLASIRRLTSSLPSPTIASPRRRTVGGVRSLATHHHPREACCYFFLVHRSDCFFVPVFRSGFKLLSFESVVRLEDAEREGFSQPLAAARHVLVSGGGVPMHFCLLPQRNNICRRGLQSFGSSISGGLWRAYTPTPFWVAKIISWSHSSIIHKNPWVCPSRSLFI